MFARATSNSCYGFLSAASVPLGWMAERCDGRTPRGPDRGHIQVPKRDNLKSLSRDLRDPTHWPSPCANTLGKKLPRRGESPTSGHWHNSERGHCDSDLEIPAAATSCPRLRAEPVFFFLALRSAQFHTVDYPFPSISGVYQALSASMALPVGISDHQYTPTMQPWPPPGSRRRCRRARWGYRYAASVLLLALCALIHGAAAASGNTSTAPALATSAGPRSQLVEAGPGGDSLTLGARRGTGRRRHLFAAASAMAKPDYDVYHTAAALITEVEALVAAHPDTMTVGDWAGGGGEIGRAHV